MKPYLFWFYRLMTKRNMAILAAIGAFGIVATRAEETPPQPPVATQQVGKASFNALTKAEQDFYHKSFDYAMETLKDNATYEWRTATAYGTITAGRHFISNSKATCRKFSETYAFASGSGTMQGVGCKRQGHEGWCKLKESDMLSCAFEPPETIFEILDVKKGQATRTYSRGKNFLDSLWPF